jgi:hypothetical protein
MTKHSSLPREPNVENEFIAETLLPLIEPKRAEEPQQVANYNFG